MPVEKCSYNASIADMGTERKSPVGDMQKAQKV